MMKPGLGLLTAVVLSTLAPFVRAQEPETPLTASQAKELSIWTGQLTDPNTSAKVKLEAAGLLLDRPYGQAGQVLLDLLAGSEIAETKIAIAEAIAQAGGNPRKEFIDPLMSMLTGKNAAVRAGAGKALLTYRNQGVTEMLIGVMLDQKRDRAVRLETMSILQRVLDKRVVGALVDLLRDSDPAISKVALETLPKLTNIRGYDQQQWRAWWRRNKDKPLSEWLGDWAENLAENSRQLEGENAGLRARLAQAMEDLYAATAPERREAMLIGLLQDPVADVRLSGAALASKLATSGSKVPQVVVVEVRKLLGDKDDRVRKACAALAGSLGDAQAAAPLLERLEVETSLEVRQAVLTSLGQLQDPSAIPALVKDIVSEENSVAAAAAIAIERIAAKGSLAGKTNGNVSNAILGRYAAVLKAERTKDVVALLEALLRAMGALRTPAFVPVVKDALKDDAAMIRLASVNSLAQLGDEASAEALVPLVNDPDRGVRQAAIVVLGKLGGAKYVRSVIDRTRMSSEPDAAVRQQARDVALEILKKAQTEVLWTAAAQLQEGADAKDFLIQVLEALVDRLESEKSRNLYAAHRQLGQALKQAGKPADAVSHLRKSYELLEKAKDSQAKLVWSEWLDVLYEHDLQAVVKALAEQEDDALFAKAHADLGGRLEKLKETGEWSKLIVLTDGSIRHLAPKLTVEQLVSLKKLLAEAREELHKVQGKEIGKLAADLLSPDAAVRVKAEAAFKSMGDQAVKPLLKELRKVVASENDDEAAERAFLAVLAELAPNLKGYDTSAARENRLKLIDKWLQGAP
jgi:HEAT repeat protein